MNRYKSLARNTAIFAFGTFGSKILSFIMVFFYSRAMATDEFGTLDIIIPAQEAANLKGMVCSQCHIGFSTEAISSKIFTHTQFSFTVSVQWYRSSCKCYPPALCHGRRRWGTHCCFFRSLCQD